MDGNVLSGKKSLESLFQQTKESVDVLVMMKNQ